MAKSKLTTVCTETTSGVASPASKQRSHLIALPVHRGAAPAHGQKSVDHLFGARARPGRATWPNRESSPTNQNKSDTVKYVETANTSQTSGLRNCGQYHIVLG